MYFVFVSIFLCFGLGNGEKNIGDNILSHKVIGNRPSSYFQTQPWAFGIMTHYKQLYFSGEKKSEGEISSIAYIFRNSMYSSFLFLLALQVVILGGLCAMHQTSLSTGVERAS